MDDIANFLNQWGNE
ncbi:hypothetical protein LB411_30140 [Klebsiella pneumoniae]|nr:hypothetical protein [Klebsiella pneumoniae]MCD5881098.1 hypothetical protein [Klebsiella pneumoniae]MCD5903943.1 hypothetical protein [Klebsiella pneumoniae]